MLKCFCCLTESKNVLSVVGCVFVSSDTVPIICLFSEQSRRQSNTLANTCHPVWQQKFVYQRLVQSQLASRVLEITVWDYDQYGSNDFLGEVM